MSFAPAPGLRHVFVHGLSLMGRIGVSDAERARPQRIVLDIDMAVLDAAHDDRVEAVVDYGQVAARARAIVALPAVRLVETLAERIAAACLEDARVTKVRVRVAKPDILPDATVGVTVERASPAPPLNASSGA